MAPPNDYRVKVAEQLARRKHRADGWTPIKVAAFIEHLSDNGSVTKAAAYVRLTTAACYALRNHPEGGAFAEAWEAALSSRHEVLTDLAMDRVRDGMARDVWYRGERVGEDRRYSDRLLIHMLRSTDPLRRRSMQAATAAALRALPAYDADPVLPAAVRGLIGWAEDDGDEIARELAAEAELAAETAAYLAETAAREAAEVAAYDAGVAEIDRRTAEARAASRQSSGMAEQSDDINDDDDDDDGRDDYHDDDTDDDAERDEIAPAPSVIPANAGTHLPNSGDGSPRYASALPYGSRG